MAFAYHTLFCKSRSVYGFGSNDENQLSSNTSGTPQKIMELDSDPLQITGTSQSSAILTSDGELFLIGQIGKKYYRPTCIMKDPKIIMISAGNDHLLILKNNGELWGLGIF